MTCSSVDLEENLALGHAEHLTGLILTARDALNAAAEDLREVAGVVDDERHQRSGEARQGNIPQQGRTVENDDDLSISGVPRTIQTMILMSARSGVMRLIGAEADKQAERQSEYQRQAEKLYGGNKATPSG